MAAGLQNLGKLPIQPRRQIKALVLYSEYKIKLVVNIEANKLSQ